MNDRDLIELAAKAAGYGRLKYFDDVPYVAHGLHGEDFFAWNPLANDGDALRLAVKLKMRINVSGYGTDVVYPTDLGLDSVHEEHDGNADAATRRAIVRAAADIAKARA